MYLPWITNCLFHLVVYAELQIFAFHMILELAMKKSNHCVNCHRDRRLCKLIYDGAAICLIIHLINCSLLLIHTANTQYFTHTFLNTADSIKLPGIIRIQCDHCIPVTHNIKVTNLRKVGGIGRKAISNNTINDTNIYSFVLQFYD